MSEIYTDPPQSRNEAIIKATIDGTEYTAPPQSRMEDLLLELKEAIEHGGGGGGTSDYPDLTHKPQVNGVTLVGNKTSADLGLMDHYDVDERPTEDSENLISSKAVYEADEEIKDELQDSKTATGNPVTVTDAEAMNAESVKVELEPKQDLHGYDKPWAGGAGKNKFDVSYYNTTNFSLSDNTLTNIRVDAGRERVSLWVRPMIQGTPQPTVRNFDISEKGTYSGTFNITQENVDAIRLIHNGQTSDLIIEDMPWTTTGTYTISFEIEGNNPSVVGGFAIKNIQIEQGSTATSYEPYSNICPISGYSEVNVEQTDDAEDPTVTNTYTIDLDGTKYGGILDVTSGVLTVDRVVVEYDGSIDEAWDGNNDIHGISIPSDCQIEQTPISDAFRGLSPRAYTQVNVGEIALNSSYTNINLRYIENGLSAWTNYLSNNPLRVCYKLATPLTVQLTPTDIPLLENTNNISTDGTNIQLKYQPNNVIGECKAYTDEKCAKVLPQPPTTDGTYHLECSVSSGIPTITWVSNS